MAEGCVHSQDFDGTDDLRLSYTFSTLINIISDQVDLELCSLISLRPQKSNVILAVIIVPEIMTQTMKRKNSLTQIGKQVKKSWTY